MARSFIVVKARPFLEVFKGLAAGPQQDPVFDKSGAVVGYKEAPPDYDNVRRPYRGLQLKEETFATLEVRRSNGRPIPMEDSSRAQLGGGNKYSNFILQSVTDRRAERRQLVETFGETWVFFSGETPRILTCDGVLVNSADFQWRNEWWHNYENYLRGTRCALNGARVYLTYDDVLVEGYMLSARSNESSQNQHMIQFEFEFLVTNYTPLITVGDTAFPVGGLGTSATIPRSTSTEYVSETKKGSAGMTRAMAFCLMAIRLSISLMRSWAAPMPSALATSIPYAKPGPIPSVKIREV